MPQVRVISISHIRCPVPALARSNALTLERVTSEYPKSGSLITFSQFSLISLHGLPKFIQFTPGLLNIPIPLLPPRRLLLTSYLVHIIFRSGGLVVSMLMGWLLSRKS
jgi:UDP-xylose/UDP-N-acetylglucosamine transporter B4